MSKPIRSQLTDRLYSYRKLIIKHAALKPHRYPIGVLVCERPELADFFSRPKDSLDYLVSFSDNHVYLNSRESSCAALMASMVLTLLYSLRCNARQRADMLT